MSLTFEERHRIRQLISAELIARLPKQKDACAGCGFSRDHHTQGCEQCQQRHKRRLDRKAKQKPCATVDCGNTVSGVPWGNRPHSGYCRSCANRRPSWSRT